MVKTLNRSRRQERVKFKVPRSVQQAIPIRRIWPDGIFQVGNQFSKSFSFTDINYAIAGKDDKTAMFLDYSELLNALDSGASAKVTINNRRINKAEFERSVLLPMQQDDLDGYREEFNEMLRSTITGTNNSIVRERYLSHLRQIQDRQSMENPQILAIHQCIAKLLKQNHTLHDLRVKGCVDSAFFQSQANAIQQQLDVQRTRLRQYQKQVDLTPILRETKRLMESLERGDYQMWFSLQVVSVKLSASEIRFTMKNKLVFTEQRGDRT